MAFTPFHKLVPASGVARTPRAAAAVYNHLTSQLDGGPLAAAFRKVVINSGDKSHVVDIFLSSPATGAIFMMVIGGDVTYDASRDMWLSEGEPLEEDPCATLIDLANSCGRDVSLVLALPQSFGHEGLPVPAGVTVLCDMPSLSALRSRNPDGRWMEAWNRFLPFLLIDPSEIPATPEAVSGGLPAPGPEVAVQPELPQSAPVQAPEYAEPAYEAPAGPEVSVEPGLPGPPEPLEPLPDTHPLLRVLSQAVTNMIGGRRVIMSGIDILPSEVTSSVWLLPALTVATALNWRPVVVGRHGKGGFHVILRSCPPEEAPCGFAVTGIQTTSPTLLVVPVLETFRRTLRDDVFDTDIIMNQFRSWLQRHDINTENVDVLLTEFDLSSEEEG